jgi:diadenosine tetraphosphatase ApaH/serine/threonine PP2A family protein phosphatase
MSISAAKENFAYFNSKSCLVSHTHVPGIFEYGKGGACSFSQFPTNKELALGKERMIINPGAVGQPRDGDPRASYIIYDSETKRLSLYRVPYDVAATQAKMIEQRLPVRLAARLGHGV